MAINIGSPAALLDSNSVNVWPITSANNIFYIKYPSSEDSNNAVGQNLNPITGNAIYEIAPNSSSASVVAGSTSGVDGSIINVLSNSSSGLNYKKQNLSWNSSTTANAPIKVITDIFPITLGLGTSGSAGPVAPSDTSLVVEGQKIRGLGFYRTTIDASAILHNASTYITSLVKNKFTDILDVSSNFKNNPNIEGNFTLTSSSGQPKLTLNINKVNKISSNDNPFPKSIRYQKRTEGAQNETLYADPFGAIDFVNVSSSTFINNYIDSSVSIFAPSFGWGQNRIVTNLGSTVVTTHHCLAEMKDVANACYKLNSILDASIIDLSSRFSNQLAGLTSVSTYANGNVTMSTSNNINTVYLKPELAVKTLALYSGSSNSDPSYGTKTFGITQQNGYCEVSMVGDVSIGLTTKHDDTPIVYVNASEMTLGGDNYTNLTGKARLLGMYLPTDDEASNPLFETFYNTTNDDETISLVTTMRDTGKEEIVFNKTGSNENAYFKAFDYNGNTVVGQNLNVINGCIWMGGENQGIYIEDGGIHLKCSKGSPRGIHIEDGSIHIQNGSSNRFLLSDGSGIDASTIPLKIKTGPSISETGKWDSSNYVLDISNNMLGRGRANSGNMANMLNDIKTRLGCGSITSTIVKNIDSSILSSWLINAPNDSTGLTFNLTNAGLLEISGELRYSGKNSKLSADDWVNVCTLGFNTPNDRAKFYPKNYALYQCIWGESSSASHNSAINVRIRPDNFNLFIEVNTDITQIADDVSSGIGFNFVWVV